MSDIVATKQDIGLMRGDSGIWEGHVYDVNDAVVNITNAEIRFMVKAKSTWDDSRASITKRNTAAGGSDAQIKVIDGINGVYELYIEPQDTVSLKPGIYYYDVQVNVSDLVSTPTYGKFELVGDITREY